MAKRTRDDDEGDEEDQTGDGHTPKFTELELAEPLDRFAMECTLPPHQVMTFATYPEYETHYHQSHMNRCKECMKNFPTPHYLSLHLAENHDPIMATKRDQGEKIYACFVEGCDKVCMEWRKRRRHLVDKHGFPKNFDFLLVDNGTDARRSLLRPGIDAQGHRKSSRERRGSSATETTQTTDATSISQLSGGAVIEETDPGAVPTTVLRPKSQATNTEDPIKDITRSMSSLQFVPRSVKFGRRGKSGFAKS